MAVNLNLPELSEKLEELKKAAKRQRKTVTQWYKVNGIDKRCPYEYKNAKTTKEGTTLDLVVQVLAETIAHLESGDFEVTVVPKK